MIKSREQILVDCKQTCPFVWGSSDEDMRTLVPNEVALKAMQIYHEQCMANLAPERHPDTQISNNTDPLTEKRIMEFAHGTASQIVQQFEIWDRFEVFKRIRQLLDDAHTGDMVELKGEITQLSKDLQRMESMKYL